MDAHLAFRLHLLEIFPRLYRCLFRIPIRACLTIHFYLEGCADVFLTHPPLPCTNVADESAAIIDQKSASSRASRLSQPVPYRLHNQPPVRRSTPRRHLRQPLRTSFRCSLFLKRNVRGSVAESLYDSAAQQPDETGPANELRCSMEFSSNDLLWRVGASLHSEQLVQWWRQDYRRESAHLSWRIHVAGRASRTHLQMPVALAHR